MLLGLIVAIFIILLVLGVAAPQIARSLRRERDVETVRRGNQYVRAIQLYYRKFGHYPGSMEQLDKTNNIRFLRQHYIDPITGKEDWRIIPPGQNKTTVKGFFGEPLAGIASTGLGSAAGLASSGVGAPGSAAGGATSSFGASSFGATTSPGAFGATGTTGIGATSTTGTTASTNPTATTGAGSTPSSPGSSGYSGIGDQSATTFSGTSGPFMGVGINAPGDSIVVLNEQTSYGTWEFLYDPRIDQMKAKAAALNGGPGSAPAGGIGQNPTPFGTTPAGSTGLGTTSPGSTGFGTTPTSTNTPGTTPTTTPQP